MVYVFRSQLASHGPAVRRGLKTHGQIPLKLILSDSPQPPWATPMTSERSILAFVFLWSVGLTLAKRRSCNESATPPRTPVSTTTIRTWWAFVELKMNSLLIFFSLNLPQRYSTYYRYLLVCLTLPIQRGIHDIHRAFAFKSNPGFIFHDSPGFESGDGEQMQDVLSFIETKAKSTQVDDQLHVIWSVRNLRLHTGLWWSVLWWKVSFSFEQFSASIATGNGVL